jgi:hypothetical protein
LRFTTLSPIDIGVYLTNEKLGSFGFTRTAGKVYFGVTKPGVISVIEEQWKRQSKL